MRPFLTPWGLQEEKCVYWKVSVGLKCVRMAKIPWLWNLLSQYWLEIETIFFFFRPPEVVNFRTKLTNLLLRWLRYTHKFNRCSRSGISTFRHWSQGLANETWNPKCESRQSPFLARNANGNPSSETSRPLATSSLAVGRFAAKQGSLRSPRGRLVASLPTILIYKLLLCMASHVCSQHSFGLPPRMNGMNRTQFHHARLDFFPLVIWSRVFWLSVTCNFRKAQRCRPHSVTFGYY